jgi:hypothetical protein
MAVPAGLMRSGAELSLRPNRIACRGRTSTCRPRVTDSCQRPGARTFTSWSSQPLPSGSLNEANDP